MVGSDRLRWPLTLALFGATAIVAAFSGVYWIGIATEIAIFAIFALSIDFLVGYTGLVTLGHAGFMGVGAYASAYVVHFLGWPPIFAPLVAVLAGIVAGIVVGLLVNRVAGVFFIMVTLAMSMLFYSWAFKARSFGGDDGLSVIAEIRPDLSAIGISLDDPLTFCLMTILFAVLVFALFDWLVRSPFGQTLKAIKQNENRIRAQGCPTYLYKVAAFTVAGAVAAFAGALHVQRTEFLHPDVSFWIKSGEGLIVVIVGGMGTLVGPILGSFIYILLHKGIEAYTQYWQIWIAIIFIVIVLLATDGVYGRLRSLIRRRGASP